jgi:DNA-binding NarL/FixJ family response regulator
MSLSVIIADDDTLARAVIEAMLELLGSAEDADGAAELVREHHPDVAVLDWVMPNGGGPAAARAIKRLSPETKIVALTSSDTAEAELDMLRAGAEAFLLKGSAMTDLLGTIHRAMRA